MSNEALYQHFTKVADASPVPVIIYSVPGNTGIDMAPEVIIRLSSHPNIAGVKDSGGDISKIGYIVHKTAGNDFQVLAGSASFLLPAYVVGAVGGVMALANLLGGPCCELERLYKEGRMEQAMRLQHRLIGPNTAVTKKFGVPGLKAAMEMLGLYGGPVRSPILPMSQSNRDILAGILKEEGFV
ncbi:hypothetical protein DPMN_167859 [Dreissena polymorpha]|uniref:4-hydroxy-2-oxoglutarate aldolase, mitochondrial n=2 Tax=Dreissena polymorpha TaxID=45954 RepID=A0A9D4F269_DREPO|nr:hypothetical protein DPMN_167859 [Dreissena polymorpha]